MSWWSSLRERWFGAGRAPARAERFEVAPGLAVSITRHTQQTMNGPVECWSYVSEGLAAHGQKELVLTLRQGAGGADEALSPRVFSLFTTFQQFASQGRTVDVGDYTQFGDKRLFPGRHLLYVPAEPLPGVSIPRGALAAVLVTDGELSLVQRFGSTRVMASLGRVGSHFPCPTWSDPGRPELPYSEMLEKSMLSSLACARVRNARVLLIEGDIVLRAAPDTQEAFRRLLAELPAESALTLLTGMDPAADAYFVWEPGQREPCAITPPGQSKAERICGSFLSLVPGQARDESRLVEDGYGWLLTDASWKAVQRALTEGMALALMDAEGGKRLRIEWV